MDEGLDVSHAKKRSLGYDSKAKPLNDVHREHILRQHVANYTRKLPEEDEEEEACKKQLFKYIKFGVNPDSIEGRYTEDHAAIRAEPSAKFPGRAAVKYPERKPVDRSPTRLATRYLKRFAIKFPKKPANKKKKKKVVKMMFENQCKLEMKTRPKKAKKHGYTKDYKEQPREICDQRKKKSLKPNCVMQSRLVCTYEPEETCRKEEKQSREENNSQGTKTFGPEEFNAMVLTKRKETAEAILGKKFSNIFPFPDKEQIRYFEPKETCRDKRKQCR